MFKFFLGSLLTCLTLSFLQIYGPSCAVSRIPNNIEYTLSNFGEILYGQTILGQIRVPNDPFLCKLEGETFKAKTKQTSTKDILLVQRGTCKFTEKVINAQSLGADLIIIYDNLQSTVPNILMKNDGHGHLAEIPSLFISKADGLKLLNQTQDCSQLPILKIEFEIDQKQKSQVTLWLDAINRETYILAREFYKNDYYVAIQDRIDFTVRFRIEGSCDDWICFKDDCLYQNILTKYCRNVPKSINPSDNPLKGVEIIYEQLREYFLWEELKANNQKLKWWEYMTRFDHKDCIQESDITSCSYDVMRKCSISESIINNVKSKIQTTLKDIQEGKENIIKQSYNESKQLGVFFYPEATINNRNFYGLFKAPQVFETICNSLINPPSQCISFIKQNHQVSIDQEDNSIKTSILVILCFMTLGFLVALFIYTRIIRREVNQQLSVEVNKMVENYVNMANKKNSSGSYSKFES